ncbi:MAG: hypothetical protein FIA91_07805 [Geobacter sp.]|nr:hypothetical protein [Geobacter sp.]
MSLFIAGRIVTQSTSLSELCRLTLSFIDGGNQWFAWATQNQTVRYNFSDESELLASVQQGLHGSRLALLPQLELMVSPVKLMTLGLSDLRLLAQAESGDDSAPCRAAVCRVLEVHQLATRSDLAAGTSFLAELGVATAPLFQMLDMDDSLAICELLRLPSLQGEQVLSLLQEAAAFAVSQASTPQEFCDYYRIYLDLAAADSPAARTKRALSVIITLQPLLFGALDCPQVNCLATGQVVMDAIRSWFAQGRLVGFATLASAVRQVVSHTSYSDQRDAEAQAIVNQYLSAANAFLGSRQLQSARLSQDGAGVIFRCEDGTQYAELQLDDSGVISLREYGAKPALAPSAVTPRNPQ